MVKLRPTPILLIDPVVVARHLRNMLTLILRTLSESRLSQLLNLSSVATQSVDHFTIGE